MPNPLPLLTYPFDPTGQALSNRITGEQHAVQEANYRDYYYIVPTYGPFFENNVVVNYTAVDGSVRILVPDVDYYFALPFLGATRSIGLPLFGAIAFNNAIIDGTVSLNYRTLGGDWTTDPATILANLATLMYNPRVALWDVVTDKPAVFPPINHQQNIDSVFGAEAVVNALNLLANTVANSSGTTIVIGGTEGGGGGTGSVTDTYAIEPDKDRIFTGETINFKVIGQGAGVPDTLYWTIVYWNATVANFATQNGSVAMTLTGGVKQGNFNLQCNNSSNTPVAFNLALHTDSVAGDIVAFTEVVFITRGDQVIAKSGVVDVINSGKNGMVFSNEQNTGLANIALKILDVVVGGNTVMRFDETLGYRSMFFGPNNAYHLDWQADGNISVFDDQGVVLFTTNGTASKVYVQNLLTNYATHAYVDALIAELGVPKSKLFFFSRM